MSLVLSLPLSFSWWSLSCSRRALRGSSADGRVDSVREPCRPPLRLRKQEPRSGEPSPSVEVLICSGLWRLTRGWARIVQLRAGQHLGPGTVGRLAPAVGPGPRSYYFSSGLEGTVRRPSPFDSILFGFCCGARVLVAGSEGGPRVGDPRPRPPTREVGSCRGRTECGTNSKVRWF